MADDAFGIHEEGRADDAFDLLAIHDFFPESAQGREQNFLWIAEQRKGKLLFGDEILMTLLVVPGDAVDLCP